VPPLRSPEKLPIAKLLLSGMVSNLIQNSRTAQILTRLDATYVDKAKREAVEDKRKAEAQWYDISYVDKKREVEDKRKAEAQWYDISYVGKKLST
jgi:hypothetical protein